jgi:hypothetical protein
VKLHFAYGSNMDRTAMARRCPGSKPVGRAVLKGHSFFITTDGYASVRRAPADVVYGVLWQLTPRDLAALSLYESLASGLYGEADLPVQSNGRSVRALVYVGRSLSRGIPKPGYMEGIVAAARDWQLPADYVRALSRWVPVGTRGARETEPGELA